MQALLSLIELSVYILINYSLVPSLLIAWIFSCLYRTGKTDLFATICATIAAPVIVWFWLYSYGYFFGMDKFYKYKNFIPMLAFLLTPMAAHMRIKASKNLKNKDIYKNVLNDILYFVFFFLFIGLVIRFIIGILSTVTLIFLLSI